jgi:hypothetical protein
MGDIKNSIALQIEDMVKEIPGWTPLDQLLNLFALTFTSTHLRGDILELGSWCGRSAAVLGLAAKLSGPSKVYCVDLFPERGDWYRNDDGSYSFSVTLNGRTYGAYEDQTVWNEPFNRDIAPIYKTWNGTLDAFKYFIEKNQLSNFILPYRCDLKGFSDNVPNDFCLRLAFIDGDHSYQSVCNDIEIIEKYLVPGGWICFDDAFSSYEGVNKAIQSKVIESGKYRFCQQLTRKLFVAQRI